MAKVITLVSYSPLLVMQLVDYWSQSGRSEMAPVSFGNGSNAGVCFRELVSNVYYGQLSHVRKRSPVVDLEKISL